PPTPAPPTLPTIDLVITPNAPAPLQPVTWRATASSPAGIQQIELLANGGIIRSCALTTICETISGPYTAGTIVRAEARAFDQSGRVATTAWTFTVSTPPVPDTTPPTAPTAVQVINSGTGSALYLFWVNPTDADFSTVRIYRSTTAGSLGSLIATTRTSPYVDTGLAEGTTYSYTFRSVDANGNESANIAQTSGTPRR
ncbi:hypothetical protein HY480_01015, partial [Candidatus Uhrbacteria bacterium]|nr:hypothetical protein [Candidatus Uhrbacteria bacterium]